MHTRQRIGIITGSGPEAGLDLWSKVLAANRRQLGARYGGDLDAPHMVIVSNPRLGLSMDLQRNHAEVWEALASSVTQIAPLVDYYAIACNTLNVFSRQIEALQLPARLITFYDCLSARLRQSGASRIALLGARPIMELGPWSHYQELVRDFDLVPMNGSHIVTQTHALIERIKRDGADGRGIQTEFEGLIEGLDADTVVLACTELPLLRITGSTKKLLDPTALVGDRLAALSLALESPASRGTSLDRQYGIDSEKACADRR